MRFSSGSRLGPYEIVSMIGAGGMGEVYRARDSRLQREVAIKVLPENVSSDADILSRLEREARTLAALNHPHIAAIYDFERDPGASRLVLELVDGPTLADRLRSGALAIDEGLALAEQIADALGAAHDRGIIHRDLKPSNIKVTPGGSVKLLDFGLAKVFDSASQRGDDAQTVSDPAEMTRVGTVLGTPAYMSPEQARGESLDKRTDTWSFGVVVYEMLTGHRPFVGQTTTDTLAAVLREDPDWNLVPTRARRLVRRCLEKDPRRRLRDIGDAMALLDDTLQREPVSKRVGLMRWLWPLTAALVLIAIAGVLVARHRESAPVLHQVRFQVPLPNAVRIDAPIVSPDGRKIAFFGETSDAPGTPRLWIHSLDSGESRQLFQANKFGGGLFWSPNSRFIAFLSDGTLKKIDVDGTGVATICDVRMVAGGGSWSKNDVIVFSSGSVLMRVPASGGTPVPVTALDPSRREIGHYLPRFLSDGRRFLYLRVSPTTDESGIYVGAVDVKPEEQSTTRLIATRGGPIYAPPAAGDIGRVLFLRESTLMAQPFDPTRLELGPEAIRVVERVAYADVPSSRYAHASVSDTDVLAYRVSETMTGVLVWVDRNGREEGRVVPDLLPNPQNPRLSPDGKRLALMLEGNLWVYDLTGRPSVKLTFDGSSDIPLWSPDGRRLVYASNASPTRLLSVSSETSGGTPQPASPLGHYHPHGWSADGRELIAVLNTYSPTNWDILKMTVDRKENVQPILRTAAAEGMIGAALSPDGQWLAYTSNVTGAFEVWVQPYPGPGAATRVSPNGGVDPVWAKDGRELFYMEGRNMMAVSVRAGQTFDFEPPVVLFTSAYLHPTGAPLSYDVAADGRFLMLKRIDTETRPTPINVVLNWTAGRGR